MTAVIVNRRLAIWLLGAVSGLVACAGSVHRAPPPSTDIDENGLRADLRTLASDEFEGRRPGTPGEDRTVAFLVEQFRKLGLKPGNGESFLQPVPLVEITPGPDASLAFAGRGMMRSLTYRKDMLIWTRREVPESSLRGSDLAFVGYGIVAPGFQWDDYAGADVHGKTVLVLAGDPGTVTKDPSLFRGNAGTAYGRWAYKIDEAARHGAAGVLLIHDAASGTAWAGLQNRSTGPQLATPDPAAGAGRPAIEGWLSADAARAVFAQAGVDFEASRAAAAGRGFRALSLSLTVDATVHDTVRRFNSANVVALLPGAKHKHEYVLYTAHWDHLGRQSAAAGGAVYNGAVDDASGVAGLLMLAQSFSRARPGPDRSIVFAAFTAAESGLLGSAFYVSQPLFALRDTVAVLNLDMLPVGGPSRDVMVFGYGNSELDEYVREAALLQGREVRPDPVPEQGLFYRSDEFSFAKEGVPAVYARAGLDDSARGPAWGRQHFDDYLSQRYLQTGDKYSPDWDLRGMLEDLKLYQMVGSRLAQSRRFPRLYASSEFREGPSP